MGLSSYAECFIKEVEACRSDIPFPAINELRYAGHHLLKGLASEDHESFSRELDDARDHCHRSMYEASEAGIGYLLELLKAFDVDYKDVPVAETVPNYLDVRMLATSVSRELSQGRLNRRSPEDQAQTYMAMFRDLKAGSDKLEASRGELNKKKIEQARDNRGFLVRLVFWVAAALIGIAGILLQLGC